MLFIYEQTWNHTEFPKYVKLHIYLIYKIIQSKLKKLPYNQLILNIYHFQTMSSQQN